MPKGKIARLPHEIRETLNLRLQNGGEGGSLLTWLNSVPAVRLVLASDFGGKPVNKQNLSAWRKGAYREWLTRREAAEELRRVSAGTAMPREYGGSLTDNMALWIAARYLVAVKGIEEKEGSLDWKRLRELCGDIVKLRRGDQYSERLLNDKIRRMTRNHFAEPQSPRATSCGSGAPPLIQEPPSAP
jgi:hypothetical protein